MFGLCFIYVIGALIIVMSYLLEHIQAWLYRRRNLKEYAYLEWTANETLQLQRMAYQGLESGHWSRYTDRIPLREPGEILSDLARSYPLDKKKGNGIEQVNSTEKRICATVISEQTAALTQIETDGSSTTRCDDDSHANQAGAGGRQSMEAVSPRHSLRDESLQSMALPHVDVSPPWPIDAALPKADQPKPQGSKDPATDTPEGDGEPAHDLSCSPIEGRSRT